MTDKDITNFQEKEERLYDLLEPLAVAYLFILSVVAPYMGLVFGIVLMKRAALEKDRRLGKTCTIISSIMLGVLVIFCVGYIVLYAVIISTILSYGLAHGPPGY